MDDLSINKSGTGVNIFEGGISSNFKKLSINWVSLLLTEPSSSPISIKLVIRLEDETVSTSDSTLNKFTNFLEIKSKKSVNGNKILFKKPTGLATTTDSVLENFTPIVFGMISQKTNIIIDVIKTAITEIHCSDNWFFNNESSFADIKLVMVTLRISSAKRMVAIIDEGVFINDSSRLPILDFF